MTTYKIWDEGATETMECDTMDEAKDRAEEWLENGEWGDDGAAPSANVGELDADGNVVYQESVSVDIEPNHAVLISNLVGQFGLDDICGTDPDDHDWTAEGEGGLDENPGVWSSGGTTITTQAHCRKCGLHRTVKTTGSQRNPGEHDTVEYELLDDEAIGEHRANGHMDAIPY